MQDIKLQIIRHLKNNLMKLKLKHIIFRIKDGDLVKGRKIEGWLFMYAELRLVAIKEFINSKWWRVYEYSTGYDLGSRCSETTRRASIGAACKLLDRMGSIRICNAIKTVIEKEGQLLNN